MVVFCSSAQVAQSVEQRTENPRVDGSIPPLGTMNSRGSDLIGAFFIGAALRVSKTLGYTEWPFFKPGPEL
jgi:hypothetical protein